MTTHYTPASHEVLYTINQRPKPEMIDLIMLNERELLITRLKFLEDSLLSRGQITRRRLKTKNG